MLKQLNSEKNDEDARKLFSKGLAHHNAGRLDEASLHYKQILKIIPRQVNALHMLGLAEFQRNNFSEAVSLISQATKFSSENDLIYLNLGNALRACGQIEEASNAYRKAVSIRPSNLDALKNLGNTYKELNKILDAIVCYDQILHIDPNHAKTKLNKAIALLTEGELEEGWDLYDCRFACDTPDRRYLGQSFARYGPDWDGTAIEKPLLVLPEQGLGDQIFYGGMLSDLQSNNIDSLVCIDGRLRDLFRRSFPKLGFLLPTELSSIDPCTDLIGAQLHIGSLGRFFRRDIAATKNFSKPFLIPNKILVDQYRNRLYKDKNLICGLSWASSNSKTGPSKSISLENLALIFSLENIQFVNLQYGDTTEQRRHVSETVGVNIFNFDEIDNLIDIDNLAALISACDVVISVSNSTAHLAAALGKPTIVLLPYHTPLWYWHRDRADSPWYPTATLIRQKNPGSWQDVVETAALVLNEFRSTMCQ